MSQASERRTLIVAGGGTGGHVWGGVAIADAWRARFGTETRVLFVGARGGLEEKLVPRSGYPLELLEIGSLKRVSLARRLKTFVQLPLAILKSVRILVRERPAAVIGVGGYASGPIVMMARFFAPMSAIVEQNSVPGFTNRMLGRFVRKVFCAFPGTESSFPGKAMLVGNPIRNTMKLLPSAPRDPFTIFIFGGSQGALGMNTLVLDALPHLKDLYPRLRWIHQTGEIDYERVARAHREAGTGAAVERFIYDMLGAYTQASLLICRAGASTIFEVATVGRAAVFVPLPTAADNHQEKNAQALVSAGGALLMPQKTSRGEDLARLIRELVADPARVSAMEQAVTGFSRPATAEAIVSGLVTE